MNRAHHWQAMLVGMLFSAGIASAQDWPQWRGAHTDNKVVGFVAPKTWPKELIKKWKVTVGIGEASPVMVGDKIFTFGKIGADEVALCLDANSGKELWREKYPAATVQKSAGLYPGPRSTPAAGDGKVCTLGVGGELICRDAATGKQVWDKKTKAPTFNTSSSPIIADGKCIVFAGALTAYDLATGASKWSYTGGGQSPYGSPVLMTVDGTKMVVSPTGSNNLVGISLADGKQLWQVPLGGGGYTANYSTPLIEGNMVYYSVTGGKGGKGKGGAGGGTFALKIGKNGDKFTATEAWKKPIACTGYVSPTLKDGLIYGVSASKTFFCMDAKSGDEVWKDSTPRGDCGGILDAGPVLLALTSDRHLVAFKAGGKGFMEVANYTVSDSPTWSLPIVAGNRIYVKDKGGSLALLTIE